jgi:anti-sigma factor RsiW
MTSTQSPFSEHEIHAYVDGQLDTARSNELDAYLATHPDEAVRVAVYRKQNRDLHALFDPILDEPQPARIEQTLAQPPRRIPLRAAAMIAWLAIGTIGGYVLRGEMQPAVIAQAPFAERAAVAHVVYTAEVLHPVEVTAEQEAHLVQWLSKRLGHRLHTPDLTPFGYQLLGGRLLPGDQGAAAQFMYQDTHGARLTLYVSVKDQGTEQSAFRIEQEDGVPVLYWIDDNLGFALIGERDRQRLMDMGHAAYQAMSL